MKKLIEMMLYNETKFKEEKLVFPVRYMGFESELDVVVSLDGLILKYIGYNGGFHDFMEGDNLFRIYSSKDGKFRFYNADYFLSGSYFEVGSKEEFDIFKFFLKKYQNDPYYKTMVLYFLFGEMNYRQLLVFKGLFEGREEDIDKWVKLKRFNNLMKHVNQDMTVFSLEQLTNGFEYFRKVSGGIKNTDPSKYRDSYFRQADLKLVTDGIENFDPYEYKLQIDALDSRI